MTSDEATKTTQPSAATMRGIGMSISMMCCRCKRPRPQLGSKKLMFRGAKRAVCKQCSEEMPK